MVDTILKVRAQYLNYIHSLSLLDDFFARIIFKNLACIELVLEIILGKKIDIVEFHTQYDLFNLHGRSITVDVFVKTKEGNYINIEVQRKSSGAHLKRARYHCSLMSADYTVKNKEWKKIPKVSTIFITEDDVLGKGLPIYHVNHVSNETGKTFDDEEEIIYVNSSIQDDTPLGRLMHDFRCTEASEMYYEVLRERVKLFKEKEEGVSEMCDFLEQLEIRNQAIGKVAGKLESIRALIRKMSLDEALDLLNIPPDERPMYIKKITS